MPVSSCTSAAIEDTAAPQAGRLLRVLLLWFGEMPADSGAARLLWMTVGRSLRPNTDRHLQYFAQGYHS
jgi:hypothetical protein